jgi:hypothetical protein
MPEETKSLASGHKLDQQTFDDFVTRLRHHCQGEGVSWHHTAAAIFTVQARKIDCGFSRDYSDNLLVYREESCWYSPQEYWDDLDDEERLELDGKAQEAAECDFLEMDLDDQWEMLGEIEDHGVTAWQERWEYVNSHFTKEAAEAFIQRKKHDYPRGMRVYVDAQIHCWEFEAIKEALMDGRMVLKPAT